MMNMTQKLKLKLFQMLKGSRKRFSAFDKVDIGLIGILKYFFSIAVENGAKGQSRNTRLD